MFKKKKVPKFSPTKKNNQDLGNIQRNVCNITWSPDSKFFAAVGLNNIRIFDFSGDLDW